MNTQTFFLNLWEDYIRMAPRAARLKSVFEGRGERVLNDHIAFRTLDLDPIRLESLQGHILALGYEPLAPYVFTEKKLNAWGFLHPDPFQPRIFLSALDCSALSADAQKILEDICAQIDSSLVEKPEVLWSGRLWDPISWENYNSLLNESEYAAWFAALGLHANHFTIAINYLKNTRGVEEVLQVVEAEGIPVNESGGRVKGSPEVLLEQGSSMADRMPVEFAGGEMHDIPTCYYEFALRYADADGNLYQGFVAASADKIFESTDALVVSEKG